MLDYIASTGPAIPELDSARGGFADLPTLIGSNAFEIGASRPFGVTVHDHIIVRRNGHASLKGLKLI